MNYSCKLGLVLLAAIGVSNAALAYRFRFSNHTAEKVNIRMNFAGDGSDYDIFLGPKGEADQEGELWFKWIHEGITNWENNRRAGFCWNALQMRTEMKDRSGKTVWGPWKEVNVQYVESNQYAAMIEASDEATAAFANIGLSAGGRTSVGGDAKGIAKGVGSLVGHSQCKDRKFDVVYVDKKSRQVTLTSLAQ